MSSFFSKDDKPLGKSMHHWIQRWWQSQHWVGWRRKISPVLFLQGAQHVSTQSYKLNSKKSILLSPINYIAYDSDSARQTAKTEMDIIDPDSLRVSLDGEPLNQWFRSDSVDFFDVLGRKAFSDGYWMFFKTLDVGDHMLYSSGSCRAGTIQIYNNYQLDITQ